MPTKGFHSSCVLFQLQFPAHVPAKPGSFLLCWKQYCQTLKPVTSHSSALHTLDDSGLCLKHYNQCWEPLTEDIAIKIQLKTHIVKQQIVPLLINLLIRPINTLRLIQGFPFIVQESIIGLFCRMCLGNIETFTAEFFFREAEVRGKQLDPANSLTLRTL